MNHDRNRASSDRNIRVRSRGFEDDAEHCYDCEMSNRLLRRSIDKPSTPEEDALLLCYEMGWEFETYPRENKEGS